MRVKKSHILAKEISAKVPNSALDYNVTQLPPPTTHSKLVGNVRSRCEWSSTELNILKRWRGGMETQWFHITLRGVRKYVFPNTYPKNLAENWENFENCTHSQIRFQHKYFLNLWYLRCWINNLTLYLKREHTWVTRHN